MNSFDRAGWRGYVAISVFWVIVLAGVLLFARRPAAQPIEILPPPTTAPTATALPAPTPVPTGSPAPTATARPLRVDVTGAVVNPRVCTLAPGSIVADAITAAGGPAPDADLERINRALELQDGMQIYVPRLQQTAPAPPITTPPATASPTPLPARAAPALAIPGLVNLNTATLAELDTLPGVGPKTAEAIIAGRPYAKVEDLLNVKGIGPATFAKLKDLVTVR